MGLTMAPITFGDYKKLLIYNMTDQKYYPRDGSVSTPCDAMLPASNYTTDQIPTADGLHKHFVGVNGSLPGPTIVVYQYSTLIVHVTNYLLAPVTIHFHGMDFRKEFYMDGVGMITQCPISHGQTFTYEFKVRNSPGTYWYHGHDGAEMSEGLYGAFIVLDPNNEPESNDFVSILSDWYPNSTETLFWVDEAGHNKFMYGYDRTDKCYYKSFDAQGVRAVAKPFHAALINGKGWHNVDELDQFLTRLPVERFIIDPNKNSSRFRLISAAYEQSFYVHVEGHQLEVIASDGESIKSKLVDGIYCRN